MMTLTINQFCMVVYGNWQNECRFLVTPLSRRPFWKCVYINLNGNLFANC